MKGRVPCKNVFRAIMNCSVVCLRIMYIVVNLSGFWVVRLLSLMYSTVRPGQTSEWRTIDIGPMNPSTAIYEVPI